MAILEESVPRANVYARLAAASIGQGRKTRRCPETPRLERKRVLVTGGTNGIGLEMARGLLARGADVILPCRNPSKGARVRDQLRREAGEKARIDLVAMDLTDLRSVREAGREIARLGAPIDVVIENAGVMERAYSVTPQGHEISFGVNVLGHFVLRQTLLDSGVLPSARVVIITGDIYVLESGCTPDYSWRGRIGGLRAYCRSKLGNLWIASELQKRHPELSVFVVHPGAIATDLGGDAGAVGNWFKRATMISPELGAQTPLICATQEGLRKGGYYHNTLGLVRLRDEDAALDATAAEKLWALCETLAAA
ncbi:MAG: SDR family NAD(P)-dependent oxidoreductase [Deltaproteobacteria bacterium]|nr:SDR family NAD(P)-dependent oxidoreductase [Deltaproteobacteria bacterium]MBI3386309.1 SDR family NAD(P)-dependent oxidoreductase [Deltaproteobacteria bacterium]